ncbi:MAG: glycine/betaine ABC transporter substrate-binding protein [Vallitaleaceae bacterium]|jgi:glycine betaine/choline ABC-type transport system substrate-binding protein|nr:glycine/betaine ABC transporter substrate-binding protein [Vallitaleaceae bacterium]
MKKLLAVVLTLSLLTLLLVGCGPKEEKKVVVAAKPFTEGYVVAEMIALIVENHTEIDVERRCDIVGDATIIHQGLLDGEIDMYGEYTSTAWFYLIKQEEVIADHDVLFEKLKAEYEKLGLVWMDLYGFNNTYALTIRKDTQAEYGITNTSDLIAVADQLSLGANFDYYEREDGYEALKEAYNFEGFGETVEVNIGLRYQALAEGEVDVINGFTTDGLIEAYDLVPLEDDLSFFKAYYASTVVRAETLEKYPELEAALDMLSGTMTDAELTGLNYLVDG